MKIFLLVVMLLATSNSFAGKDRGGGDPCESRILTIRDDIQQWIHGGGHEGLKLPSQIDAQLYSTLMLSEIGKAKVNCVSAGDKGYPVQVDGTPKVCRFDKTKSSSKITCDSNKFQSLSESDQYVLIHHEYAGLAKIEPPQKDQSAYAISNQISGFLVDQIIKKLAIKPSGTPPVMPNNFNWTRVDGAEGVEVVNMIQDAMLNSQIKKGCQVIYDDRHASHNLIERKSCRGMDYSYGIFSYANLPFTKPTPWALDREGFKLTFNIAEFSCNLSDNAKQGIFLYKEKNGKPIYKQYYHNTIPYPKDYETLRAWNTLLDVVPQSVGIIYTLNKERTRVGSVKFEFYSTVKKSMDIGSPEDPNWVEKEYVVNHHNFMCLSGE